MSGAVAAVVVRWRGGEEVARCLRSLVELGGERLAEVVLVDSGSGDGGAEALAAQFPAVKVLALAENRSFALAANQGVAATHAPLLLLLNPDTELLAGSLAALAAFLDERPQAAGAVPLLVSPDGTPQHRWQLRRLPSFRELAIGRSGPGARRVPLQPQAVEQPAAAAWLLRRSVWDALGGFDPQFAPAWWEDVDLCARLRARIGESAFPAREGFFVVPAARVLHQGGASVGQLGRSAFLAAYHGNLLRYARRHHPRRARLVATLVRLSLRLRAQVRPGEREAYLEAARALPCGHLEPTPGAPAP